MTSKYIFVAGAPGSKWSSVVKNIYYSPDIDSSDYRDEWTYYHDASGTRELMHLGAYFDPGMQSNLPENINELTRAELEAIFDAPFATDATGIRIIKSHVFSNHIDYLRRTFPEVPIVLVYRGDDACLGWWVKCGHFDITYPLYHSYYQNLKQMAQIIKQQNAGIVNATLKYPGQIPYDNQELCKLLNIKTPPEEYQQVYEYADVKVVVI
jgi:hypothetical protein